MVALKVQPIQGLASVSEEDRQRFARECEILSSLNHRSVADVIDFGITPNYLYLALEYFPCGSMRERLKNPVSERDALNYARQIASALQVVHAAGIVHRDLKPSNLMLTTDNRVVLIDFGSARAQLVGLELSRSDLMTGTPYYVCPEQIDGHDPDQRGDLYSLGVILYEMLAGRLPFLGNNLAEIFQGHRERPIPLLPAAQSRYQPLINRLLAKNPDERFATASQFLDALNSAAMTPGGVRIAMTNATAKQDSPSTPAGQESSQPSRRRKFDAYLVTLDDELWPQVGSASHARLNHRQIDSIEELAERDPARARRRSYYGMRAAQRSNPTILARLAEHSPSLRRDRLDVAESASGWAPEIERGQMVAQVAVPFDAESIASCARQRVRRGERPPGAPRRWRRPGCAKVAARALAALRRSPCSTASAPKLRSRGTGRR